MTRIYRMTHAFGVRSLVVQRVLREPWRKGALDFADKREETRYVNQALAAAGLRRERRVKHFAEIVDEAQRSREKRGRAT